jgi:hypothetical protein
MAGTNGLNYTAYDPTQDASANAQNMVNNQNQQYQGFLSNLPQYQNNLNNQTLDQGNQSYNVQKNSIDQSANARGLLYSGLKTGAEQGAANTTANNTQNQIAQNNTNLSNYATGYGNQVAQGNLANYQSNSLQALQSYQNSLANYTQGQGFLGIGIGGGAAAAGTAAASSSSAAAAARGGWVPGKADNPGKDDPKDDKILVVAGPDELIIPKSETKSKDKSHKFVDEQFDKKETILDRNPKGKNVDMAKALASIMAIHQVLDKRKYKESA